MSKVNRGEKILNRLVSEQKITPQGRDWLIAAMDPFHDSQLDSLEGWPDVECGASVVYCVKKSVQVQKPALTDTGNWDCHIMMWPMTGTVDFCESLGRQSNVVNGPAQPIVAPYGGIGGLQIGGTPAGGSWNPISDAETCINIAQITLDSDYSRGSGRLIGIGFEVHDTTAELYKQGACTVYRMQAENRDVSTYQIYNSTGSPSTPYAGSYPATTLRLPPQTQTSAMLIPGSRQWDAEQGCYVVGAFCSEENPAIGIAPTMAAIYVNPDDDYDCTINTSSLYLQKQYNVFGGAPAYRPQRVHPIHQSGAIFSGLAVQASLTVNVNFFYEAFPGPSDVKTLVLAKPSCKYDPCVMELYSRLVQELPVGVPVSENGLGDWFLDAATKAAKYIGPALAMMPHPIAKGAGAALTYLGNTGSDYVKQQNQRIQPPNAWETGSGVPIPDDAGVMPPKGPASWNQVIKKDKKKVKKAKKNLAKAKAKAGR